MNQGTLIDTIRTYWGFESLRPLQEDAILAGIEGRDSVVVLPTGGGKSLCYQVPAVVAGGLDVVVSPLISLMKDQVDGLLANGYPAAALHSLQSAAERSAVQEAVRAGEVRLLFVSPERLALPEFLAFLERAGVRSFAVDEAHCISHWGHDFRPEYRRLAMLRERFPNASVHAFTATATPRVREDIARELRLRDPLFLVGRFDRPNLVYRVLPKTVVREQVSGILARHAGDPAIVYCLSRRDTETLAAHLRTSGVRAAPYHAGMEKEQREQAQEAFAAERIDVVVATVAFGMGIDRSNVRCVIHASMPKSVEHYQQETGRAGRDGLEAECVLLYSYQDVVRWEHLLGRSAEETDQEDVILQAQLALLRQVQGLCGTYECRHRALARYFGQDYEKQSCEACDVCLGEVEILPESTVAAQKILSCVARLDQGFGVGHVVQVLRGSDSETVRNRGHQELSTFGLLADLPEKSVTNLVYQLVDQGLLERTDGDRPVLRLNRHSVGVLRGEVAVRLRDPGTRKVRRTKVAETSWEGVDGNLFERLRALRRTIAGERGVPAYVVFGDETLRGLARVRPTTPAAMRTVRGIGEKKLADPGPLFLDEIRRYCEETSLPTDQTSL